MMHRSFLRSSCSILVLFAPAVTLAQINRDVPSFTPTIDGVISASESQSQLQVPMVWPVPGGALLLEGSGFEEEDISGTWYVSWDLVNLYISAAVMDDTPIYRNNSPGPYNGQDVIQANFNPLNDPNHAFSPDPGGGPAAIYDIVFNTNDDFGPDIYRHGALLTPDGHDSIAVAGQELEVGYVLESAIPWATAMDDVDPDYVPEPNDIHGLSFILLSFAEATGATADIATLFTDFGNGNNTIGDPKTWNTITLQPAGTIRLDGDFNLDGVVDLTDFTILASNFNQQFPRGGESFANGDLNLDGFVNLEDFIGFRSLFNANGANSVAAVPEPSSIALLVLCLTFACTYWRSQHACEHQQTDKQRRINGRFGDMRVDRASPGLTG